MLAKVISATRIAGLAKAAKVARAASRMAVQ
jgi:hypothetical protein